MASGQRRSRRRLPAAAASDASAGRRGRTRAHAAGQPQRGRQGDCGLARQECAQEGQRGQPGQRRPSAAPGLQPAQQRQQVEGGHQRHRASADVGDRLGLHRMHREQRCREQRQHGRQRATARDLGQHKEDQQRIGRMQRDVDEPERERRRRQRPVQRIRQLQQRTYARHRAPPRVERVHGRIVDDDVVVIELERKAERRQVGQRHQRRQQPRCKASAHRHWRPRCAALRRSRARTCRSHPTSGCGR